MAARPWARMHALRLYGVIDMANMARSCPEAKTMIRANISELRNGLSAYLRRVRRGESVLILDRSVPIARLTPVEVAAGVRQEREAYAVGELSEAEQRELEEEARVARLEAAGILSRPKRGGDIREIVRGWDPLPGVGLVEAVLANRREEEATGYR